MNKPPDFLWDYEPGLWMCGVCHPEWMSAQPVGKDPLWKDEAKKLAYPTRPLLRAHLVEEHTPELVEHLLLTGRNELAFLDDPQANVDDDISEEEL